MEKIWADMPVTLVRFGHEPELPHLRPRHPAVGRRARRRRGLPPVVTSPSVTSRPSPMVGDPIAWNTGGALNFAAVAQWVAFTSDARPDPGDAVSAVGARRSRRDLRRTGCRAPDRRHRSSLTSIAADPHSGAWAVSAEAYGADRPRRQRLRDLIAESPLAQMRLGRCDRTRQGCRGPRRRGRGTDSA